MSAVKHPLLTLARLHRKRLLLALIALAIYSGYRLSHPLSPAPAAQPTSTGTTSEPKLEKSKPTFTVLQPAGTTVEKLGGWSRVSPPDRNAVYAFADTLDSVPISVSQQPLPKSFYPDIAGHIADLARDFGANETVDAGDTKVYIGTSAKGPQSVIFTKNNLLVLMKSSAKIDKKLWQQYVSGMH